ncbi:MAG: glutathione S-transferase family protein [Cyanobacteriota bacterium]|jgi:glutathione S-transferase
MVVFSQQPARQEPSGWGVSPAPLTWHQLERLAPAEPDRVNGPTNAQATLRLFGQSEASVRVTLYRDHHAWCPYCQKVWLWLEERRIPYRVRKVTMNCYGDKEPWYRQRVPSGMLPALELDGRLLTESDRILEALERAFGSLGPGMTDPAVVPLRQLERDLFRAWCEWLCWPHAGPSEERARAQFHRVARAMEAALAARGGPFFLGAAFTTADLVFVPYVERMNASLVYYKGVSPRQEHPGIHRWLSALEQRSTYLGTQSDFHTHAHDLPPQMGGCYASGDGTQRALANRVDQGPWPIQPVSDPETSQSEPADAALVALARVLKHRDTLLERNPLPLAIWDPALRCALTTLVADQEEAKGGGGGGHPIPPAGSASGLRHLRDRISVPRDMPLHAARRLRQALEATASRDPVDPEAQGTPIPIQHRRDQDPRPFLAREHAGLPI